MVDLIYMNLAKEDAVLLRTSKELKLWWKELGQQHVLKGK